MMTPREKARQIISEVTAAHGVHATELLIDCRKQRVVRARVEVARRLEALGFISTQISRVLNKERTTISFYLGRIRGKPPPTGRHWHRPKVKHLAWSRTTRPKTPPEMQHTYLHPYAGAGPDYEWKERL